MTDPTNAPQAAASDAPAPAVSAMATASVSAGVPVDLGDAPSTVSVGEITQGHPDDDCKTVAVTYPDGSVKQHQVFHLKENAVEQLWDAIRQHFRNHFKREVAAPAPEAGATLETQVGQTATLEAVK